MYEFLQFELNLREIARAPLTDDSLKETSQKLIILRCFAIPGAAKSEKGRAITGSHEQSAQRSAHDQDHSPCTPL